MTSLASGKEGLFPFLNLPKELRDMVYDELTEFELYGVSFERSGSWRGDTEFYRNKCRNFNHEVKSRSKHWSGYDQSRIRS